MGALFAEPFAQVENVGIFAFARVFLARHDERTYADHMGSALGPSSP